MSDEKCGELCYFRVYMRDRYCLTVWGFDESEVRRRAVELVERDIKGLAMTAVERRAAVTVDMVTLLRGPELRP